MTRRNTKESGESTDHAGFSEIAVTFVTVLDPSGTDGGSVATKEIIKAFCRNESIRLSLICSGSREKLPAEIQEGVTDIEYLPSYSSPGSMTHHGVEQVALFRKMLSSIRTTKPDLIVSRLAPSLVIPPILTTAFQIPYVPLARGWLGIDRDVRQHKFARVINLTYRLNFAAGDHTYVPVGGIKDEIREINHSIPVSVFSNAVDPDLFAGNHIERSRRKLEYSIPDDAFVIGFVGSFADRHRMRELFCGFRNAIGDDANAKLLIVGGGVGENQGVKQLIQLSKELDIEERVIFTGPVPHNRVPRYISACDVMYGVSAPERPTAPIKVFEYLSCERPVITTDQPELAFVPEYDCGYVLSELSSDAITEAITHYRQTSKETRLKEGKRGREYVKKYHTWDKLPEQILEDVIQKLGR